MLRSLRAGPSQSGLSAGTKPDRRALPARREQSRIVARFPRVVMLPKRGSQVFPLKGVAWYSADSCLTLWAGGDL